MKRNILLLTLALVLLVALALTGCAEDCQHDWKKADCENAKTCTLCGRTKGEPLGHSWKAGTCNSPKTCETCGATQDVALGHSWKDATCQDPKTCTTCGLTEGEIGDHSWKDATCMESKRCTTCGLTEGGLGDHEILDATCEAPQTCAHCGLTVGVALGHDWTEGDCENPRTCLTCGMIEGYDPEAPEAPEAVIPTGHVWLDANCEEPKHCQNCDATEGDALGHSWVETGAGSKTCSTCGTTEGGTAGTDPRFQTEKCKMLFGTWKGEITYSAEDLGMLGCEGSLSMVTYFTFNNDGTAEALVKIKDMSAYIDLMTNYMYATYEQLGYSKDKADQDFMASMGMTIPQYAEMVCKGGEDETVSDIVYYVDNDALYMGETWSAEMVPTEFQINGNKLTMYDPDTNQQIELTRM